MGQKTSDVIKEKGGDSIFVNADVAVSNDVKKAVEATKKNFGKLTSLVNCAACYAGKIFNTVVDTSGKIGNELLM